MTTGINLLPQETKPKVSIVKLSNRLRRLIIVGFVILIFLTSTVIGIIFILSNNNKSSTARQTDLKNQIQSLEVTEQKLVLIRDRLSKAKTIQGIASTKEELATLEDVINDVNKQDGVKLSESELDTTQAKVNLSFDNSNTLSKFIDLLKNDDSYKKIDLQSLGYDNDNGYSVNLTIIK